MSRDELEQPLSPSDEQIASPDHSDGEGAQDAVYDPSAPLPDEPTAPEEASAAQEEQKQVDSYLDDDELITAASDEVLQQDEDTVIVQQEEAVVKWDIQGLYDETGKVRSKRSLRNNPPMLVISDSLGDNATFVLTKELSGILARHFDNTYRAYYGIRPKDELTFKEKLGEARTGIQRNMGKLIIIGGVLAALLIFGLVF